MTLAEDSIKFLVKLGLYDVILPFILVFSISYGVLDKTKVLGDKKNINSMVSFVLGFLMIVAIRGNEIFGILVTFFTLFVISLIFMFVMTKFIYKDWKPSGWPLVLGFSFLSIAVIAIFIGSISWEAIFKFLGPILPAVSFMLVIVLIVWFILKGTKVEKVVKKAKDDNIPKPKQKTQKEQMPQGVPRPEDLSSEQREMLKEQIKSEEDKLKQVKKMFGME